MTNCKVMINKRRIVGNRNENEIVGRALSKIC